MNKNHIKHNIKNKQFCFIVNKEELKKLRLVMEYMGIISKSESLRDLVNPRFDCDKKAKWSVVNGRINHNIKSQ